MQQITLDLDVADDVRPEMDMEPQREQRLIALMAEAIVAVLQSDREADHEQR